MGSKDKMSNLEPKTQKDWYEYLRGIDETELNMNEQYPEHKASNNWAFSLLRLEATHAYSKWVMKRASRGLKK
jgi:hypothetical protein